MPPKKSARQKKLNTQSFRRMIINRRSPRKKENDVVLEIAFQKLRVEKALLKRTGILVANVCALFAVVLFFFAVDMYLQRIFPVPKPVVEANSMVKRIPSEIKITAVGIDLPIFSAAHTNNQFQTTSKGVSYLSSSPLPGTTGNSVLYAHNWPNLFGNLVHVVPGEKIVVIFSDASEQSFTVTKTQTVHADDVAILNNTKDKRITLFTCQNFLDADRFVVTAMVDRK